MEDLVSGFNIMYEFRTLLISFESEYEWRNIVCDEYFNDIELIRWIWQSVKDELIWIKYFTIVFKIYTAVFIIFTQSFNKIYNAGIKPQNFIRTHKTTNNYTAAIFNYLYWNETINRI